MRNKLFLLIFVSILFTSLISGEIETLGTFAQNEQVELVQTCSNCTYVNILSVKYPNSSIALLSTSMSSTGNGLYNYTFSNTSALGEYIVNGMADVDGVNTVFAYNFYVTKTGVELTQDKALVYLGMVCLLVFLFVLCLFVISKLPSGNSRNEDGYFVEINNLKYLRSVFIVIAYMLIVAIVFVSSNISYLYLEDTMFGDLLFKIFIGMGWMIIPMLFLWFIYIFISAFQDRQLKRILERGFEFGEKSV